MAQCDNHPLQTRRGKNTILNFVHAHESRHSTRHRSIRCSIVTKGFLGQGISRQSIDGVTVSTLDVLLMRSNLNYTGR